MPIRRRTWSGSARGSVTSSPSRRMAPSSTVSSRFTQRSSVDFPEPDAPISAVTVCAGTVRSTDSSTTVAPNDFRTPVTSRTGVIAAPPTAGAAPAG
jgi:hypothetical protein